MNEIKIIGSALPNIPWEDRPEGSSVPLWRYSQNPIIKRNQLPDSNSIFNSAVVKFKDGLSGNEDVGQMSAWYILSAMGLYQVEPAGGKYIIGSPIMDKATISLGDGKNFSIICKNNSPENIYVQSAKLNGKTYTKSYIMYQDMMKGGTLELQMGNQPSKWGTRGADRP
jgi:putative alpha-1,2-mannosidase